MLLILRGLPGSGKSTFAKELVASSFDADGTNRWKRVSKDDLREMADLGSFSVENETMLNVQAQNMAIFYLTCGYNVVYDNMSLRNSVVEDLVRCAKDDHFEIRVKDFHVDPEECIVRDSKRSKPVTESAIRKIHAMYFIDDKFPEQNYGVEY